MENKIWDVIVIGGGPAGMMAAGRAGERNKKVLLLEKNPGLGKKLLITGGGRCNVTNHKLNFKELVTSYKDTPKALYSVFSRYGVGDTIEFFKSYDLEFKIENEGRMFPVTDSAKSVWDVMLAYMKDKNVTIQTNAKVMNIKKNKDDNFEVITEKETYYSRKIIMATGGTSHPETGSTGEGFEYLKKLGHNIVPNSYSLVPIETKESWVSKLSGLTLQDTIVNIYQDNKKQDNKKQDSKRGKVLFTHFGLTGPTILNLSEKIGSMLPYGEVQIKLDLIPDIKDHEIKQYIQDLFEENNNRLIKNVLGIILPYSLITTILELSAINGLTPCHSVSTERRKVLRQNLKSLTITVRKLLGADKAIVSSGGVDINEVDFMTMESKVVPGLYPIGDVLNIDRPSGGYSLQLCWSTGWLAGESC